MNQLQQGDVCLERIDKVSGTMLDTKILAEGEVTGHSHRIEGCATLWKDNENFILQVFEPSVLVHEEHKPVNVGPGVYAVSIVKEFDYDAEEARNVVD